MRSMHLFRWMIPLLAVTMDTAIAGGQVIDFRDQAPVAVVQEALPTPEEIIDRHIEVTGGRQSYEQIRNRKVVGTFSQNMPDNQSPITIYESEPGNRHVQLALGGGVRRFIVNQDESWTYDGDTVVASSGDQKQQEIRRAKFHPLLQWNRDYELARTIGIEDVNGRPAYKVRLTAEDCHKVHLFFDTETGRHVRTVQDIAYAGDTIQTDMMVTEYREFDGVMVPTKSERILLYQGNRTVQYYEYQSVEHNIDMPADLFSTPPELAPAQDMDMDMSRT